MIGAFELQQPSKPSHEAIFTIVNLYLSTATCYLLAVVLKSVTTFIRFLSLTAETARSSSLILDPPLRLYIPSVLGGSFLSQPFASMILLQWPVAVENAICYMLYATIHRIKLKSKYL